jgi:glycosyltransferase involved in cell wall biosynthesis
MKILLYSYDWAPTVGGVQTITMLLASEMAKSAQDSEVGPIDVTLVTPTAQAGMHDHELPFRVVRSPGFFTLTRLVLQADLVHLAGPILTPLTLSILLRKRVVVEHHGFQAICPNGQLFYTVSQSRCPGYFMMGKHSKCLACNRQFGIILSFFKWLGTFPRRALCKLVDANITPTNWLAEQLQLPRMQTIYHGVPLSPTSLNTPKPPIRFAFLGRLVASKGVPLLLAAASQLIEAGCPFQLFIIGDGPEREALERIVAQSNLSDCVSFTGYLDEHQLGETLALVSSVIIPSGSGEVFNLAAAENMRHGRIAIVPSGSAVAEVAGDSGITFIEGDARSLAGAMKSVIEDADLRKSLSQAARDRSRELFPDDVMVRAHIALYRSLAV